LTFGHSSLSQEVIDGCVARGVFELPPAADVSYLGFVDPSGGASDAMTLAIAHRVGDAPSSAHQRPFRPNGTGARHSQLALLVASARLTSFGEAWFQRRKAWRKFAVSLKPKACAISSTVISVSRKYFIATSARD
jgi:hypothetical protein